MNIQIFGKAKCFDTKKAERWFKERKIRFQSVDIIKYGLSNGEFTSVCRAVGGFEALLDPKSKDADALRWLASDQAKIDHMLENPKLLRTPIVRNDKQATIGYHPEIWSIWE